MLILILGFLFAAILQIARVNRFNTISGMATLENLAVAKVIAFAIGLGMVILNVEIAMGWASYHVKPLVLGGVVLGGLIFGAGMAVLGYCPGTLVISAGEGSLDAGVGIAGGLLAGLGYTSLLPSIESVLGPDLGKVSLSSALGSSDEAFPIVLGLAAVVFMAAPFWLHRIERGKDYKWLLSGAGLAVLNPIVFDKFVTNRPIGASTMYPYVADRLADFTSAQYYLKIQTPGRWELIFLAGAFLAGVVISLARKEFRLTMLHENWKRYRGASPLNRAAWAFAGGFVLIFGARMAGGCTSGHVLSGGMQLAFSSLLFAIFAFAGLLATGKLFYRSRAS